MTQTRSKLNGETKHIQTGGSVSFIYCLSQGKIEQNINSKRLIYIATSKKYTQLSLEYYQSSGFGVPFE